jgi:hypothetical protein
MSNPVLLRLRSVELYERPVTLRLPFRFGAATVTRCPQAFVRVVAEVAGRSVSGASAELMVPKWFDKSPQFTHEQNFEQLREALRCARESHLAAPHSASPWALSQAHGEAAVAQGMARGLPRLAAQFGAAVLDKAVADAALRAAQLPWVQGVRAGVLGDPHSAKLSLHAPATVAVRHTVGLADRLTAADAGIDPHDGLPATLQDAIHHYSLHHFKLKLSGQRDADLERLARITELLEAHAGDYRVTLDGNETFANAAAVGEFWRALEGTAMLQPLLQRTLLLEQPLPRHLALRESIRAQGIGVPVILDESDDHDEAFDQGIALGYRGISSKACKGIYRSLRNAVRASQDPQLLLSGEDLTCQAGLAVQQDTLLAASLGVTHIERNGHHYVDGFGIAPEAELQAFAEAHPGFYERGRENRPRLRIHQGHLDLRSLLQPPGFASAAAPRWDSLTPIS